MIAWTRLIGTDREYNIFLNFRTEREKEEYNEFRRENFSFASFFSLIVPLTVQWFLKNSWLQSTLAHSLNYIEIIQLVSSVLVLMACFFGWGIFLS